MRAVLVGGIYFAVGVTSAALAGAAGSDQMTLVWRWSAFIVSGVVFAADIAYEHVRLRSHARRTAWRTATAVAVGGFALAVTANIHDLGSASGYRPRMLIALVAWPVLTAAPASLVALVVAAGLGAKRRGQG